MKTVLHWSVYAYNMPDMTYRPTEEVSISVFAETEKEAIEKAKTYFTREKYQVTHVHEMPDQEDLIKQSHGEFPRPWEK